MSGVPTSGLSRLVEPESPVVTRAQRRWLEDERLARLAWSRLADPADLIAGTLRHHLGECDSLAIVLGEGRLPRELRDSMPSAGREVMTSLERWRVRLPMVEPRRDIEAIEAVGGTVLVPGDPDWPVQIADLGAGAPPCLWVRGTVGLAGLADQSVAMVGSRASTRYGEMVTADLVQGLCAGGARVMSGAAFGIDAAAHRAAIACDSPTIAVLACGADRVYPAAHGPLLDRIVDDGLIVSESPPGAVPTRWRFLERNRLIAAMSKVAVIVEAAWRSGALNTARHARELGRSVAAVPGPVTSAASAGCHRLIREQGAVCVTDAAEVLELLHPIGTLFPEPPRVRARVQDGMDTLQQKVWEALPVVGWLTEGQLAVAAGLPRHRLLEVLRELVDDGRVVPYIGSSPSRWKRADLTAP